MLGLALIAKVLVSVQNGATLAPVFVSGTELLMTHLVSALHFPGLSTLLLRGLLSSMDCCTATMQLLAKLTPFITEAWLGLFLK
jgi:hypothetical protein